MKNGLRSGGLNPWPLSQEFSALTTRLQLLSKKTSSGMCPHVSYLSGKFNYNFGVNEIGVVAIPLLFYFP
jgi:hypothetical protein